MKVILELMMIEKAKRPFCQCAMVYHLFPLEPVSVGDTSA